MFQVTCNPLYDVHVCSCATSAVCNLHSLFSVCGSTCIVVLTYMIEYNVLVQCLPLDNEPIKLLCSKNATTVEAKGVTSALQHITGCGRIWSRLADQSSWQWFPKETPSPDA